MISSVGVQRVNRQTFERHGGRWLGALGAGFVLMLAVGAPAIAATSSRVTTHPGPGTGPGHGYGYGYGGFGPPPGVSDPDGRGQILLERLEAFRRELREHQQSGSQATGSPTPPAKNPTPTPTTTVPITTPPTTPPTTAPPAATVAVTPPVGPTAAIATATPLATHAATTGTAGHAGSRSATLGGPAAASPPAGGVPVHTPQTRVSTPITRVLGSAPSYGLLFTLVGAVLVFLAVQSRMDRRDPRIARAPIDAYRDFRDFE